jgi:general secretion pathway protein D
VVAVDSSNSLAIRGDAPPSPARPACRRARRRAAQGTEIRVVFLQHADAAQLLPVIQHLLGQPVTAAPPNQGLSQQSQAGSSTSGQQGNRQGATRQPINTTEPTAAPGASGGGTGSTGVFGPRGASSPASKAPTPSSSPRPRTSSAASAK